LDRFGAGKQTGRGLWEKIPLCTHVQGLVPRASVDRLIGKSSVKTAAKDALSKCGRT
jgi:hypothetical protein